MELAGDAYFEDLSSSSTRLLPVAEFKVSYKDYIDGRFTATNLTISLTNFRPGDAASIT
jgi:hypothetical protein